MPKTKQFEAFDLNGLLTGKTTVMLSMIEMSDLFYKHITDVYRYLEQGKNVSIEVPNHECFYRIIMKDSKNFKIFKDSGEIRLVEKKSGLEFVNWLFAIAPFISLIGIQKK